LYFDDIHGNPNSEDNEVTLHIFSKNGGSLKQSITLNKSDQSFMQFSNVECTNPDVRTRVILYETAFTLLPSEYNDPSGYYVIWQRCCRNHDINNIDGPDRTGSVFYTEFPPVQLNQNKFINSSPEMLIPKGDFLCKGLTYTTYLTAKDADGDQLRYSIDDPLAGNSSPFNVSPNPISAPYPSVNWLAGFSTSNPIPHNPEAPQEAFFVNPTTGQISITASEEGLFAFAIKCEEFRNGVKIGEVHFEFQWWVLACPNQSAPQVNVQNGVSEQGVSFYTEDQIMIFKASEGQTCLDIWVKDAQAFSSLNVKLLPKNFQLNNNILSLSQFSQTLPNDSTKIKACFPTCLFSQQDESGAFTPLQFDLVVQDNSCPYPLSDTLKITLIIEPIINHLPILFTDLEPSSDGESDYQIVRYFDEPFDFKITGQDLTDQDSLEIRLLNPNFEEGDFGINFPIVRGRTKVEKNFTWQGLCEYLADEKEKSFLLKFYLRDFGKCENKSDTISVKLILRDKESDFSNFKPNNVFTPNGDRFNQYFSLDNIPIDNCKIKYRGITIYNRWGEKVYFSPHRDFKWDGDNLANGVYYYDIDFTSRRYKGTLSIIR
jgi:gliding motility-associated-like protein